MDSGDSLSDSDSDDTEAHEAKENSSKLRSIRATVISIPILGSLLQTLYLWVRDFAIGALIVALVIVIATIALGVWPPMGAVASGSMSPSIAPGDAVVFSDTDRFVSEAADENGVVTWERGKEMNKTSFGDYGIIISYNNPNRDSMDVIHRPMFYVEEGEDWVERANPEYLGGAESCDEIHKCPAPHDGYITKGDNNGEYDQVRLGQGPVKADWVTGVVEHRIPYIGWLRLLAGG